MTPDDFAAFYRGVHGYDPFPWQARLVHEVATDRWPAVLDLPTAAGKTSTLDIALFTLALQAGRTPMERTAPLRVFFVIDRRLVVDQAAEHAHKLQRALESPQASPVVREVADRLHTFGGPGPLHVAALRGGLYRDDSWARAPNQPTVCISTVDQVGSRLLFRGYGLSEGRRPVHAALVGNDALYLIDEAHLSQPFLETLHAIRFKYRGWAEQPQGGFLEVVEMSATPLTEGKRFLLGKEDRDHKVLRQRLQASKPAMLREPVHFEVEAVTQARDALGRTGVKVVGVVVNRVASARKVFEELRGDGQAEAVLLTGRIRPWDRERLLDSWLGRMRAGRTRAADDRPLFVVATQTVEVGADLDFDFLVTEAAPLPALRQRFGRLDRLGQFETSAGVILRRETEGPDPVYGEDLGAAWDWLQGLLRGDKEGVLDFGIDALDAMIRQGPEPPRPAERHAPVLLPTHLDNWVQTNPAPQPDPDVAPFLHGPGALEAADVQIIWRADLSWDEARTPNDIKQDWVEGLTLARPTVLETLPVPVGVARDWLRRMTAGDVADVEGASTGDNREAKKGSPRPALRWRGPEDSELVVASGEVRAGDTLVVPSVYGGADEFGWRGWEAGSPEPVRDVGDLCFNLMADAGPRDGPKRSIRIRLHPGLVGQLLTEEGREAKLAEFAASVRKVHQVLEAEEGGDYQADLRHLLTAYRAVAGDEVILAKSIDQCLEQNCGRVAAYPGGVILHLSVRPGFSGSRGNLPAEVSDRGDVTAEDDTASVLSRPVSLKDHTAGVTTWVKRFTAGFDEPMARVLERAAEVHDLGKADPRFQTMLYGGDEIEAAAGEVLAKSGMDREDAETLRRAWRLSRLPRRFRHEFVSVALVRQHRDQLFQGLPEKDRDLAEYLVGTHHGHGRPFPPVVQERDPEAVILDWGGARLSASPNHGLWRLGSGWADLFWSLVRRFGYWGLANLEAALVLADQACSREHEQVS